MSSSMPPRRQEQPHEQQHEQTLRDMEASARQLHELLQTRSASRLLQQPPPAAATATHKQKELIAYSDIYTAKILKALQLQTAEAAAAAPGRMLGLLLHHKAVHSVGTLLAWLQQRPEKLQFHLIQQANAAKLRGSTPTDVWGSACNALMALSRELWAAQQAPQPACSAAALAAATLQQLEQSGLLSSLHASMVPLVQAIRQQWGSTQERLTPFYLVFGTMRSVMFATEVCFCSARELVPAALQHAALQATLLMLQQLQGCGALSPAATTDTRAASSQGGSSSSISRLYSSVFDEQWFAIGLLYTLHTLRQQQQMSAETVSLVEQMLLNEAVQGLLWHPVVAFVSLLHQQHQAQQQQQQQRRPASMLQLLPIPAFLPRHNTARWPSIPGCSSSSIAGGPQ
uniref:Uncharacterized protein n=1 Tax=Tetradesmus obliquus TaxID=3088 RepID=A0A383VLK6_TETOB|eukprot:jgi/Sobl393_1/4184/SZX65574.1